MSRRSDGTEHKDGNRSKRGSVNNAGRLEAFSGRAQNGGAEWDSCDPVILQGVISEITGMGGAITFSLSRDQGAHALTLMLDNERQTLWFNGDADLTTELQGVFAVLETMKV